MTSSPAPPIENTREITSDRRRRCIAFCTRRCIAYCIRRCIGIAVPPKMVHNHPLRGVSYQFNSKTTFRERWARLFSVKFKISPLNP